VDAYFAGRFAEAETYFRRAIALSPNDADSYRSLGSALTKQGKIAAAIAAYRTALKFKPTDFEVRTFLTGLEFLEAYRLGAELGNRGDSLAAEAAFRRAIALDADDAEAHFELSIKLLKQRRIEDAIAERRRSIQLDPSSDYAKDFVDLHHAGADSLDLEGKYRKAEVYYREAFSLRPTDRELQVDYSWNVAKQYNAALDARDLPGQVEASRKLVMLDPDDAAKHQVLGELLMKSRDVGGGKAAYHEAIRLQPNDYTIYSELGRVLKEIRE